MSDSEYEGHEAQDAQAEPDSVSPQASRTTGLPGDFSEDERLFAQELRELFNLDNEELPPNFAQTLLEAHDPRLKLVNEAQIQKAKVRVLRQLHLQRRLFAAEHSPWRTRRPNPFPLVRPLTALFAACLLFMCLTMALALPSFAAGLNILWAGTHSGVMQVGSYPQMSKYKAHPRLHTTNQSSTPQSPQQVSLSEAQSQLQFPLYWPLAVPSQYDLNGIYLYQGADQQWADGPIVDMEYAISQPGITPGGSGKITLCEFKPMGKVLQEVQLGSSQQLQIDSKGNAAIFVDGQWVAMNNSHSWIYGGPGELIYEHSGVIFWIGGDQRDGITKDILLSIAHSLAVLDPTQVTHMMMRVGPITEGSDDSGSFFAGQVIYVNNPDGSFTAIVGDDSSSSNKDIANTN